MTQIRFEFDEKTNKIVNMFKVLNSLNTKEEAINGIINNWGDIQSLDIEKIKEKVLEKLKEEHKRSLDDYKEKMKKCYEQYSEGIENIGKNLSKKYKLPISRIWETIEYAGEDAPKGKEKLYKKIFDEWENGVGSLQNKLPKKCGLGGEYDVIQHEESFWHIEIDYCGLLELEYSQHEEDTRFKSRKEPIMIKRDDFIVRLDFYLEQAIEFTINILRGENSFYNVIKESKEYLAKAEKQDFEITPKQEEELDAQEELMGI